MRYAQIIDGKVNMIECEPENVQKLTEAGLQIISVAELPKKPRQGDIYKDGKFITPEPEKPKIKFTVTNIEAEDENKTTVFFNYEKYPDAACFLTITGEVTGKKITDSVQTYWAVNKEELKPNPLIGQRFEFVDE